MQVLLLRNAPSRLKGHLSQHMTEIRTNTFVGTLTSKEINDLWLSLRYVSKGGTKYSATLICEGKQGQGLQIQSFGDNEPETTLLDGVVVKVKKNKGLADI